MDRRRAGLAEAAERVPEPAIARLGVDLGNDVLHEPHGGPLLQLAGGNAVDANDGRFFRERDRPVDTGDRQRGAVGEGGVPVEELQEHWLAGGDTIEEIAANAGLLKRLVVKPPALHPAIRSDPLALREEAPPDVIQARGVEKVGALGADRAHQRVDVGVGQARERRRCHGHRSSAFRDRAAARMVSSSPVAATRPSLIATALHVGRSGSRVRMRDPQMIVSGCAGIPCSSFSRA